MLTTTLPGRRTAADQVHLPVTGIPSGEMKTEAPSMINNNIQVFLGDFPFNQFGEQRVSVNQLWPSHGVHQTLVCKAD